MLIQNERGNYSFLKGSAPYSGGVVAEAGFEVVHVRLSRYLPVAAGFDALEAHLKQAGRPLTALCGMELRSPKPFSFAGFRQFNAGYIDLLKKWDLFVDGINPVARTNVAPAVNPPGEPSLYGFSYTAASQVRRKTFVVAGGGELREGAADPQGVVQRGDCSAAGMREKARYVMDLMEGRLKSLGAGWSDVTVSEIYTVHEIHEFLAEEVVRRQEEGGLHGITWHYARPPIEEIEYEMDLRGCATELVI